MNNQEIGTQKRAAAKAVLIAWAREREITPSIFSKAMGYSYSHAWQLLSENMTVYPTLDLIGRMLAAYGAEEAQLISDSLNGDARENQNSTGLVGGQEA